MEGIAPGDDQCTYAKTPGASTNPRQGTHTLAPPTPVRMCKVCSGLVRPEHSIGVRNGIKMFQGLALPVSIGGEAIRMPAFYQGPVGVLNLVARGVWGKSQGCIAGF